MQRKLFTGARACERCKCRSLAAMETLDGAPVSAQHSDSVGSFCVFRVWGSCLKVEQHLRLPHQGCFEVIRRSHADPEVLIRAYPFSVAVRFKDPSDRHDRAGIQSQLGLHHVAT